MFLKIHKTCEWQEFQLIESSTIRRIHFINYYCCLIFISDTDSDQILTYEEVRLYYPRTHQKRPLVLIGPQKVGRHELRQRLMEDTNRFAAAVPR